MPDGLAPRPDLSALARSLREASPRLAPPPTPWRSLAIHGAVLGLFVLLLGRGLIGGWGGAGFAWGLGIAYVLYDTSLLLFTAWHTRDLAPLPSPGLGTARPSLAVLIAARDEAAALPATIEALRTQTDPPEFVLLADDGSRDGTAAMLTELFGLAEPSPGTTSCASPVFPALRWLRLAHGGKAAALNEALLRAPTELVMTVDADTVLAPGAVGAMRAAFAADPALVAASGVLSPSCGPGVMARGLEWFQTYEYVRNALNRAAFARAGGLLLVSGALAGFRRAAVLEVGGFDAACLVEDYELIHRLRRHASLSGRAATVRIIGAARGRTDAPGSVAAFVRQRRRWFGGFLQTQYWYRDMAGDPRFGRVGMLMLPVKAIDTMQPLYGLGALALLVGFAGRGAWPGLSVASGVIAAKLALDLWFHLWSVRRFRVWTGERGAISLWRALGAALAEPFSFQLLRHVSAAAGWGVFLRGGLVWGRQAEGGIRGRKSGVLF